ncbi:MAG: 50S ribosomal protein L10 [Deltaproteobacteria bacterium]|nr:50S ribosomal protein L10 [Deltaproteobacteria bacterium]
MKKDEKKAFVADMNDRLKKAKAAFLVDYQGLDVEAMNRLRTELRKVDAEIQVVKNRLLKLSSRDTETEAIKDQFIGPCALAITYDDVVAPAKVLTSLSKELKQLTVKVGQISGKPIDSEAIKRLADLPGRDQLIAQVLSAMQGVPASFVRVLNGVILKLLYALKAIESSKVGTL